MHGRIVKFRRDIGIGIIRSEDGRAFRFIRSSIVNNRSRLVGTEVDFLISDRNPREILILEGTPWTVFGSGDPS